MKAMLLAAGLGTRLKPFTDKHPKALAVVNGKTLLQRNIEYLKQAGIGDVIVNVHHFADQIQDFLLAHDHFGINIQVSDERDEVLETGGGIQKASWFFDDGEAFLVMNVDILTQMDLHAMMDLHRAQKPLVTLAVSARNSSRCFLFNQHNELCGWRNHLSGEEKMSRVAEVYTEKAFSGIQILQPEIFAMMQRRGKFSIVDVYLDLAGAHRLIAYDHSGVVLIDAGRMSSISEAEQYFS